jgi:hypothetical protein
VAPMLKPLSSESRSSFMTARGDTPVSPAPVRGSMTGTLVFSARKVESGPVYSRRMDGDAPLREQLPFGIRSNNSPSREFQPLAELAPVV